MHFSCLACPKSVRLFLSFIFSEGVVGYAIHLTALSIATAMAAGQVVLSPLYRYASSILPSWAVPRALAAVPFPSPATASTDGDDDDLMNWEVSPGLTDEDDDAMLAGDDSAIPAGLEGADPALIRAVRVALRRVDRDPLPFKVRARAAYLNI